MDGRLGTPSRILVVDGSEVSREVIRRTLERQLPRTEVVACRDAATAIAALRAGHFDLVTTSLMLPDMDGLDLCRSIRGSESHRFTPLIVISGDADGRLLREGFAAGVTDYYDKNRGYAGFPAFLQGFLDRNRRLAGHVLYVEDSQTAALVNGNIMKRHGLEVTHVLTAEQAVDLLQEAHANGEGDRAFDIVVTDFFLKGRMTGGDLLHAIRARFHYSQQEMPVLVITGDSGSERQADVFHAGANDFVTKPIVEEVLIARLRALLTIKRQYNTLSDQAEALRRLSVTDTLTGVRNRRFLLDHGENMLAQQENQPFTAMLVDIDHFKAVNDNHGHLAGDQVLEAIGNLLTDNLPPGGEAIRFGGEEFLLLLPHTAPDRGCECAESLRRAVERQRAAGLEVTVSVGVASNLERPEIRLNELLRHADEALYQAKQQGRNRACLQSGDGMQPLTRSATGQG